LRCTQFKTATRPQGTRRQGGFASSGFCRRANPFPQIFESPSRFTVGLERHILETIGFDFRAQYPQKLLIKMVRKMFPGGDGKQFLDVAYDMSIDLYKTFAPLKQSTFTIVLAILELATLVTDRSPTQIQIFKGPAWHTSKTCVFETMLDLLDLYTQFPKSTKIGARFDLNKLMDVKIEINKLMSTERYQRYYGWCDTCAQEALETSHQHLVFGE
jgi:CTD kinase subunit beta